MRIIIRAYFFLSPLAIISPFVWSNHNQYTQKLAGTNRTDFARSRRFSSHELPTVG
jgi:hypothetical protein